MSMKDFLQEKYGSAFDGNGNFRRSNSIELAEYLDQEKENPDLSGISFDDLVEIKDMKIDSFTAENCDFDGGLSIEECQIAGDLSLINTYVKISFSLISCEVRGNFTYPQNLPDLIENDRARIRISDFTVVGTTEFVKM